MSLRFAGDRWAGNGWASIDIDPVAPGCFLPILLHLSMVYHFEMPPITDTLDGYVAEFDLLDSRVILLLDTWTFSMAFEQPVVRDHVLAHLLTASPTLAP